MLEHVGMKRGKATQQGKQTSWGNKPEGTGERGKTKKILRQDKTIQTKQDIPKQWKKFYL